MGRIDFFLGALLFFLLLPAPTQGFLLAPEKSAVALSGTVYAEGANQGIALAHVVLSDENGNSQLETMASDSGEFAFQGLQPGDYILKVRANGFEPAEIHVDLSLGSERGLSVILKRARTESLRHPAGNMISAHELGMPEAARNLLASGKRKLYTDKNPQGALRDFQSAIEQAPTFYEADYQAGMAYLSLQNTAEAEKHFRKSVESSQQKCAEADIALGTLLLHRNAMKEGETLLRKGLAFNPNSWPGQFELGELEMSRGHVEPALSAAEQAEILAPRRPMVYRLLAVIHLRQKNYAALLKDLDSYLQLDPDGPAAARARELRKEAQRQLDNLPGSEASTKK
jgi:tetratricopeptide (TPR) repeat protein